MKKPKLPAIIEIGTMLFVPIAMKTEAWLA